MNSKWSPDEPSGVSGLHLLFNRLDSTWTLSGIFILIVFNINNKRQKKVQHWGIEPRPCELLA
jgi:hypothetical protein